MNITFIGASKFGLRCLEAIQPLECCKIAGVITAPQTFTISYNPKGVTNVLHANFNDFCHDHHVPCHTIANGMKDDGLLEKVIAWQTDILIVVGWYHMIPKSWLTRIPTYGMHASLLPDYSGGAPLVWAIINDEKETGISLFQFADGVDNGPLVDMGRTIISHDDTIATVYDRIEDIGIGLLVKNLPLLAKGTAPHIIQDETKRRIFPQRSPADGKIDWTKPAHEIYNFIRAQTRPYPGAFSLHQNKQISIWKASVRPDFISTENSGHVLHDANKVYVICGDGHALQLHEISVDGQDMVVANWINTNTDTPMLDNP